MDELTLKVLVLVNAILAVILILVMAASFKTKMNNRLTKAIKVILLIALIGLNLLIGQTVNQIMAVSWIFCLILTLWSPVANKRP